MVKLTAIDLQEIASAQVLRNTRFTYLIDQANRLPYCKRNILLTKLFQWDAVLEGLISRILQGIKGYDKDINVNNQCKRQLIENNLAQEDFVDFFFKMHEPLTCAFLKMIARETANGLPLPQKIKLIVTELTELLNISMIELEGMDISCKLFGADPLCPQFKECGIEDCQDVSNVYTLVMCQEYFLEDGLFDKIVSSVGNKVKSEEVILIVDYRNMRDTMTSYDWEASGGAERFSNSISLVKAIYFYHTVGFVDFGDHLEKISPYIIPNKEELERLKESWKDNKELIYFN